MGDDDAAKPARLFAAACGQGVTLTDGWLLPRSTVEVERTIPDVDEDRKRVLRYRLRRGDAAWHSPVELPACVSSVQHSPSGASSARIVTLDSKPKRKVCLELWQKGSPVARVDGSKLHGKVLCEGTFGGFAWSSCENRVAYVAERAPPDGGSSVLSPAPSLDAHVFREDWGEKLGGSDRLAIFVADFEAMTVAQLPGVPEDATPGQPAYWGEDLVYTGWQIGVRRLGALYCLQRPSALYVANLSQPAKAHVCLTPDLHIARAPRPAPPPTSAGEKSPQRARGRGPLVFLASARGFETHVDGFELFVLDPESGATPRCVVRGAQVPGHQGFAGICLDSALPRQCWAGCGVFFNTYVGARETTWRVDVKGDDGPTSVERPKRAEPMASVRVLAATHEMVLLAWSSPGTPCAVVVRHLSEDDAEEPLPPFSACAIASGVPRSPEAGEGLKWRVHGVTPSGGGARFDAVLVEPTVAFKPGLILHIHGGPHSVSTTAYDHHIPFLVRATQCAVLLVNYRGSVGFGSQALQSLPGKIGEQDVQDCMAALRVAFDAGDFDTDRVAVVGGSHGGFLTAHLLGQHPSTFQAGALRNPVINIASLVSTSDIPDWAFIESLGLGSYDFAAPRPPTGEEVTAMWKRSPIAHAAHISAPALICLGMKDQRVPPFQGLELYHTLRARGVPTKLLCYEDECHALDGPVADADHWVNVAAWFNEHLPPAAVPRPPDVSRYKSFGV